MAARLARSHSSAVIVSVARTPIARFCGSFQNFSAPELGSIAIRGALSKLNQDDRDGSPVQVDEVYMGNVVSAGIGQAPCRQAVLGSGMLPKSTVCTTINKVCASGMKSVMLATQAIQLGAQNAILAGGFESMTQCPHLLLNSRHGTKLGHAQLLDSAVHDGLWDPYNHQHMGRCAEKCALDYDISREEQDDYAVQSYTRAQEAIQRNAFAREIVPVQLPSKHKHSTNPVVVDQDEEPTAVNFDKLPSLRPAFPDPHTREGTVTPANASSLNDGAAALVLMSEQQALENNLKPLARIMGYGDAEQDPQDFTTSPSLAIPVALDHAGMTLDDVEYHEINEAFAVVALANIRKLGLQEEQVNVLGGAVALGHPIGMSGARIVGTLLTVLEDRDGTVGCASICNGGGGASAIVLERI